MSSRTSYLESPVVSEKATSILTCWKDIASYVGRGVRTVQRWERVWGFPVRRTERGVKSIVLAIPAEIDAWVQSQQFPDEQLGSGKSKRTKLLRTVRELRAENLELRAKIGELQGQLALEKSPGAFPLETRSLA